MRDLSSNLGPAQSLRPQVVTAAVNGTGVDLQGYDSAMLVADFGLLGGTTPTETIQWQDSDDNATFANIAAADLVGGASSTITLDPTTDESIVKRSYIGTRRFVRGIVSAVSGTGPTCPISLSVVRGHPAQAPVA